MRKGEAVIRYVLKRSLAILSITFPVPAKKFPLLRNSFPVNLRRELREKLMWHSRFLP